MRFAALSRVGGRSDGSSRDEDGSEDPGLGYWPAGARVHRRKPTYLIEPALVVAGADRWSERRSAPGDDAVTRERPIVAGIALQARRVTS